MKNAPLGVCLAISLVLTSCGAGKGIATPEKARSQTSAVVTMTDSRGDAEETIPGIQKTDLDTKALDIEKTEELLTVNLSVGGSVFQAKLYNHAAARELVSRLPLELDMSELHGNEKYYYLTEGLPTDPEFPGSIRTGDLMLYGSDCLVLFYEDFQSSFSYTRLGYLENPAGLSDAVGTGSVTVTFELPENAR